MQLEISGELRALLTRQSGVLSRPQAVLAGLPPTLIDNQLRSARWQRLQQGVYATFTGSPSREAILWGALLRAGRRAALSHRTAAELHGLTGEQFPLLHVTVPAAQRVAPFRGAIIHHSRAFDAIVHPTALPPRTRVEDTVLDLAQSGKDFDDAFNWLCRSVGRGLTTPELMRAALLARTRLRWRSDLLTALDDVRAGVRSPLERRYVYSVERAHGLPAARRQVHLVTDGQSRYIDNLYDEAMLAIELDGRAAHPPEQRWADSHRDNAHAGRGILTLRYNWPDVNNRACATASEVATLLTMRGTPVTLRRCGPGCTAAIDTSYELGASPAALM
jgi:very-short-patch-repair endonuclease